MNNNVKIFNNQLKMEFNEKKIWNERYKMELN